jgi:hypothetical protein
MPLRGLKTALDDAGDRSDRAVSEPVCRAPIGPVPTARR